MRRFNPMGLEFFLRGVMVEGQHKTQILCLNNRESITLDMQIETVSQCWYNWTVRGQYIQQAFRELPAEQREFLMTAITPAQWTETFKDMEE